jgi:hypothetical protein
MFSSGVLGARSSAFVGQRPQQLIASRPAASAARTSMLVSAKKDSAAELRCV